MVPGAVTVEVGDPGQVEALPGRDAAAGHRTGGRGAVTDDW